MKFVHIADVHFDAPFQTLNQKDLGDKRRLEQRQILKEVIQYIQENQIPYLFICGDLYEQQYIKQSTIEYINQLFQMIPNTKIFIVPGNHDPYIKNSYYQQYSWSQNVYIFSSKIEKVEEKEIDIYGFGFDDFYMNQTELDIQIQDRNKFNILLTHGSIDGNEEDRQYNPMPKKKLKECGFDYIGLGHIHKPYYNEKANQKIVYPGSLLSFGFDELGKHGMILGDINLQTKETALTFIPFDKKEFIEWKLEISNMNAKEELIETINHLSIQENKYYKIILIGNRNFEINIQEIQKYIQNENIIKIKDKTTLPIDLQTLAKENNLKGIFVQELLQQMEKEPKRKNVIMKAIELGIQAMNQ